MALRPRNDQLMKHAVPFALALVASFSVNAQQIHQVLWDTLDTSPHRLVDRAGLTGDGGAILSVRTAHGIDLVKTGADGIPVWRKDLGLPGLSTAPIFSNLDGGHLHLHSDSSHVQGTNYNDEDTATLSLRLTSLNNAGEPLWSRRITASTILPATSTPGVPEFMALQSATGDLFVLGLFDSGFFGMRIVVIRIDVDGQVIWARRVPVMEDGFMGYPIHFVSDGSGGVYLVSSDVDWSLITAARIGTAGDLIWAKRFGIENSVSSVQSDGVILMDNGDLCVGGNEIVGSESKGFLYRVSAGGVWQRADLYGTWMSVVPLIQVGDTLIVKCGNGIARLGSSYDLMDGVELAGTTGTGATHEMLPRTIAYANGHLRFIGDLRSVDQTFGYTTFRPADWSVTFDPASGCGLAAFSTAMDHDQVPEVLLAEEVLTGTSEPIATTTQTMSIFAIDRPLWTVTDACSIIGEAPISVDEVSDANAITIANNPSEGGAPVMVTSATPVVLDLYDARGAKIIAGLRTAASTSTALDVSGLAPGIYPLLVRQMDGRALGTWKVVVQ